MLVRLREDRPRDVVDGRSRRRAIRLHETYTAGSRTKTVGATIYSERRLSRVDGSGANIISMSSGRAISFSLSVICIAVGVAFSAPSGPDSPRAKLANWLRAHGHSEAAIIVAPDVTQLPGMDGGNPLPPLP